MGSMSSWAEPGFTRPNLLFGQKRSDGLEVQETPGCVADRVEIKVNGQVHDLQEDQLAEFLQGFELFFAEAKHVWERPYDQDHCWDAICVHDSQSVADRFAALELTPLQRTSIGGFLEILSMNQPENASYVETMRCWSLTG